MASLARVDTKALALESLHELYSHDESFEEIPEGQCKPCLEYNEMISLYKGDIVKLQADAIVNAADPSLLGGGGIDAAIHQAAGPGLVKECRTLTGCAPGRAVVTDGYKLPCKKVIHTVGPKYLSRLVSAPLLGMCYTESLRTAVAGGCKTIVFPAISTGAYQYPTNQAADVALKSVRIFLETSEAVRGKPFSRIVFCLPSEDHLETFLRAC